MTKYFWNRLVELNLKQQICNAVKPCEIKIAVAFCSFYGAEFIKKYILDNSIPKEKVEIVLSKDFNTKNPSEILQVLISCSNLFIRELDDYHPKYYLFTFQNHTSKLITGSGNLTRNGLENNLEFFIQQELASDEDIKQQKQFWIAAKYKTRLVTNELIQQYHGIEDKLDQINSLSIGKNNLINSIFNIESDPFLESSLTFSDHLFIFKDYETFFPRNAILSNEVIYKRRIEVQAKLLSLVEQIEDNIARQKYDLHKHWDTNHITSLTRPCIFNNHKVPWLGVRFGKTQDEINALKDETNNNENEYGFQKHSCMQFSVFQKGFWIGIFHSVPHGALDRLYFHEKLRDLNERNRFKDLLRELPENKYTAQINTYEIPIMSENIDGIIDKYVKEDTSGYDFSIGILYPQMHTRLIEMKLFQRLTLFS